jgi:hypothetical protein
VSIDTFLGCVAIAVGLIALRDEFRPGGALRREPRPRPSSACDDCGAPAGNHYLHCDRVQFVIEANVTVFRQELARWDGSLDEIRSAQ